MYPWGRQATQSLHRDSSLFKVSEQDVGSNVLRVRTFARVVRDQRFEEGTLQQQGTSDGTRRNDEKDVMIGGSNTSEPLLMCNRNYKLHGRAR